jgi:hypothetical protein
LVSPNMNGGLLRAKARQFGAVSCLCFPSSSFVSPFLYFNGLNAPARVIIIDQFLKTISE